MFTILIQIKSNGKIFLISLATKFLTVVRSDRSGSRKAMVAVRAADMNCLKYRRK